MKQFFITGTDTGVGKTLISAILARVLNAHYWKPIQSGLADDISEQVRVQQLTALPDAQVLASHYALQASLSPDQAARLENISIDLMRCKLPKIENNLIVEGAGGIYVPLNESQTMLDLMRLLQLPIIIVARGILGTINHTLLTITVLRQWHLPVHGVILSGELNPANQFAIEKWGNVKTFHIPKFTSVDHATIKTWIEINKDNMMEQFL